MARFRALQDFIAAQVDVMVECLGCGRRVRADPRRIVRALPVKWRMTLGYQASRLRCAECGHRGARLAPVPRIKDPLDCDEFRADIDRMWRQTMTDEEPAQEALFVLEGPDEDGCVWICSPEGRDIWCQNLGPFGPAGKVMADWLAQNDWEELGL